LTIGAYVNCCQHIEGAGRTCAIDSYTSPYSAIYVLYKGKEIVAQSWVWYDIQLKGICFDNIEALGNVDGVVLSMFKKLADRLITAAKWLQANIVTIGTGYSDVELSHLEDAKNPLKYRGYDGYSDANYYQKVLSMVGV